jgi:prepilin-type N-terminal cleavage/methylation domain-containing protein
MSNAGGSHPRGRSRTWPTRRVGVRREGFTLIELMVVIAIIVILVAITIPVYRSAREHVHQTACMANLYHIATALRIYRVDEGAYPGPYDPVTGDGGLNQLYPYYLDNRKALICPDDMIQNGTDYVNQYRAVLQAADAVGMYAEPVWENRWVDQAFFAEHYSTYNNLYNFMGYVRNPGIYSLCGYADQEMGAGDSISYWFEWYRWDPEGRLGYTTFPQRFDVVDAFLHYDLAQQVYWPGYLDDPSYGEDPTRLVDALGRPLWDMGDAPWDPGVGGWFPYGIESSVFPGLINRNAPDNTIVTRCPSHRRWTMVRIPPRGSGPPRPGGPDMGSARGRMVIQQGDTPQDIVLRLDGSCSLVRGLGYDWAMQPR